MKMFGQKNYTSKSAIELNLTNLLILVVLTLVLLQGIGLMFGKVTTYLDFKLGPLFVLIAVGATAMLAVAIFKKLITNQVVSQKDIFAIVVTALLAVMLLFFLRDLLPEIFEPGVTTLQSMVGLN